MPATLLAALTDGGTFVQRLDTGVASLVAGVLSLLLLARRGIPDRVLAAMFPLAALMVTAVAAFDPPLALTPMFYVWPLMTAACFLRRRKVLITYAAVVLSFGAASLWGIHDGPRLIQFVTVAIVGAVVVAFVSRLERGTETSSRGSPRWRARTR